MTAAMSALADDVCARCDYDLRGVPDDEPCPECGLLAARSRDVSTDLSDATPRWLRGIAIGTGVILIAQVIGGAWLVAFEAFPYELAKSVDRYMPAIGGHAVSPYEVIMGVFHLAAIVLVLGVWMLTRPQRRTGRAASEDRGLRAGLRVAACMPLIASVWTHGTARHPLVSEAATSLISMILVTAGCAPLPALLFVYLRRLAQRVLHARLAKDAAIVGIGFSITLLMIPVLVAVATHLEDSQGAASWLLALILLALIALLLFGGWSMLNCVRFILAFARAYRGAQRKWAAADRSAIA